MAAAAAMPVGVARKSPALISSSLLGVWVFMRQGKLSCQHWALRRAFLAGCFDGLVGRLALDGVVATLACWVRMQLLTTAI